MFYLTKDTLESLKESFAVKITSRNQSTWDFMVGLIPEKIRDPESHKAFDRVLRSVTRGESALDLNGHYKTITETEFKELYHGLLKLNKLLNRAGVRDEDTLLTSARLERIVTILMRMTREDAINLQQRVKLISEKSAKTIAQRVMDMHPGKKQFNEREVESEYEAQKEVQSIFYNETVDRIHACRCVINLIHAVQLSLRSYTKTIPLISDNIIDR